MRREAIAALPEQEFGREVQNQPRKQRLQVHRFSMPRQQFQQASDMPVKCDKIKSLFSPKERLHHLARMLPERPVHVHHPLAQH